MENEEKKPNKPKKSKGLKIALKILIHTLLSGIGSFILFVLPIIILVLCIGSTFFLFIADDATKEKIETVLQNYGINLNSATTVTQIDNSILNLGDLSPMPIDITSSDCNCEKKDYYMGEGSLQTKRFKLSDDETEGNHFKAQDWIYSGWTIQDSEYWDIDFSKFTYKNIEDPKEFLFNHKVNNIAATSEGGIKQGRCTMTYEFGHSFNDKIPTELNYEDRNGSFIKSKDGDTEWLDFGSYRFQTYDGRIISAFAPMITTGQGGFEALLRIKQYFHKGDVWQGQNATDNGNNRWFTNGRDDAWVDDCGVGTYIDCVFEDNISHTQIVIPFIYGDAKNMHWFNSMGQRADQRYGQVHGKVNPLKSNGSVKQNITTYTATLTKLCNDTDTFLTYHNQGLYTSGVVTKNNLQEYCEDYIDINDLREGNTLKNLKIDDYLKNIAIYGYDSSNEPCYLILNNFQEVTEEKEIIAYGDNDLIEYQSFSPIEIYTVEYLNDIKNNKSPQDFNSLIMNTLLNGFHWEGQPNNTRPDWSLIGMRVYKDYKTPDIKDAKEYKPFTEISKQYEVITNKDEIQNNTIIEYCNDPNCKCTICSKIAR